MNLHIISELIQKVLEFCCESNLKEFLISEHTNLTYDQVTIKKLIINNG